MNIRTVGVGLAAGGYFMTHGLYVVDYLQQQMQSPHFAFLLGLNSMSIPTGNITGGYFINPLSWAALCIGAGLFSAGIIWPLIEDLFFSVISALPCIQKMVVPQKIGAPGLKHESGQSKSLADAVVPQNCGADNQHC